MSRGINLTQMQHLDIRAGLKRMYHVKDFISFYLIKW